MISIIEADSSEFYFSQKGLWHLKVRLQIMMNSCDELLEEILVVKRLQFLFYSHYEMNLMIEMSSFFIIFLFCIPVLHQVTAQKIFLPLIIMSK